MGSNILFLPFRRSHTVRLSEAVKQYILDKYDQHPDMFTHDLEAIDKLRSSAIHAQEPHPSNVLKLQAYAAQLVWLSGKFPTDIGVEFPWYAALGYNTDRPVCRNNLRFEMANIVYNLAAMYSQLAISSNRSTSDGLRTAANNFCLGAGVLTHLRTALIPELDSHDLPEDMDIMALESLERLLLAQAQECFWQKAVKDGLKDTIIAKLAARVSDLYSETGDFGVRSDAISSEWTHHITAKHHHFAAAAQFRASRDALEKRKYGEEVARLKDSLACVQQGLREQRYVNKVVLTDLNGLKNRVAEDLKRAEKDNDVIYLDPVPSKPELKLLDRANMVTARVPKELAESPSMLGEGNTLGPALFAKLVPYSVHVAASIYADRRDRLINHTIIDELQGMTRHIHEVFQSLNLPGSLQALEKPLGIPPGLKAHAEEIRQQDGVGRVRQSVEDTKKVKRSGYAIYQEGCDMLENEETQDEAARRKHGTDYWKRPPARQAAAKLFEEMAQIDGWFRSAAQSDDTVETKLKENEYHIGLLSGSDRDLENFVPSGRRPMVNGCVEREAGRVRGCFNDVNRLESRRRRKIETLRTKVNQDDIYPALLHEAARLEREFPMQRIEAVQFESLFDERLSMYNEDQDMVQAEAEAQEAALQRLQDVHVGFVNARRGDQSTKQREQALQALENAFFKYKEVISNLDVGRRFYNDLAKIVSRFRDDCAKLVHQRKAEAAQLETDLSTAMAGLRLQQQTSQRPQYGHDARTAEPQTAPAPAPTRASMAPPAGMWSPDMGIRFGPAGSTATSRPSHGPPQDGRWDPAQGVKFAKGAGNGE